MKTSPLRVLLVEDNPGDARLVHEMLSESPWPRFAIMQTQHLEAALDMLRSEPFDAVLLDLLLDDSPRLGTLMEIYEMAPRVPVVVLSGMDDKAVGLWVLKEGAQDYLVKGKVDAATLVHAICEAIERHDQQVTSGRLMV